MKLSKENLFNLYIALKDVGNLTGARFSYAVARNLSYLKSEAEALEKAHNPDADYVLYDKERAELAEKHAQKVDGKAQTTTENGIQKYVIEDQEQFDKDLTALQGVHKGATDKRQKQLDDFKGILKEVVEVQLHMIPAEYIPEDITAQQMANILTIVSDDNANKGEVN